MIDSVRVGEGPGVFHARWQRYEPNFEAWILMCVMIEHMPRDCMKIPAVPRVSMERSQRLM